MHPFRPRVLRIALEVLVAVALSTGAVALLDTVAPATGLSVVYLVGVLVLAARRGQRAASAAAVLGVLAMNFFFIPPIHRLTIRDSENIVALVVFLAVALVVGRLAGDARARAAEAQAQAREAAARRGEAEMLAEAAAVLLGGGGLERGLPALGPRVARALGVSDAEIHVGSAPPSGRRGRAVALPLRRLRAWVQLPEGVEVAAGDMQRVLTALGALIDVAGEQEALAERSAETDAARRADAVKTAVLHTVSHDLRSPLTAITTASDALAGPSLGEDDRADLVAAVREESARLARLVDELLDLSRIEAQAVNPQMDWCDLRDVVASAASQVAGAQIAIALPEDLPLVRADHAQMERVFVNLLRNAAQFSPAGRPVRVSGGVAGESVSVRVSDEGPGVALARRGSIFEPFQRGRRTTGQGHGSGLGLAICKGFVEANGGQVRLGSRAEGGAVFAVSLPLVPQPVPRT